MHYCGVVLNKSWYTKVLKLTSCAFVVAGQFYRTITWLEEITEGRYRRPTFVAFEEVLENAVKSNADFLLLGGDSFHENKPTRDTVYRSISSLRKYCLGNADVNIKMVSDGLKNFRGEPEFRRKIYIIIYINAAVLCVRYYFFFFF